MDKEDTNKENTNSNEENKTKDEQTPNIIIIPEPGEEEDDNNEGSKKTPEKDIPSNNENSSNSNLVKKLSEKIDSIKFSVNNKPNFCSLTISKFNNINNNNFLVKSTNFFIKKISIDKERVFGKKKFILRYKNEKKENEKESWKNIYFILIIIEKSIFYFNQKKYKECFDLLFNEKIIKNNIELGVFLITVDGFDRDILAEFLSDDSFPNEKREILDTFLNCIYMHFNTNNSILNILNFLLSLLNSPKKIIIDKFSELYFMANKHNESFIKVYKSLDIFSLLINNIVLINNIFINKEKEKAKMIKIDQFVKMNKDIEKKLCQNIYKYIQDHPLYSGDSYLQKMYKKLSFLTKEYDENAKLDKTSDIDSFYEKILNDNPKRDYENNNIWFSYRRNLSNFTKEDEEILLKPTLFTKYINNSIYSHPRVFVIKNNFTCLIWAKSIEGEKVKGNLHTLKIEDIIDIYLGVDNCEVLKNYLKKNCIEEEYAFITIKSKTDLHVIKAENKEIALKWFKAIKSLFLKFQSGKIKDKERINEHNINKIEKGIEKIWKMCIYKKWTEYGRYLLYKKQNKLEYKKQLNSNIKREKIIKSDLIDDKMNFNLQKISKFMSEIKNKSNEIGIENLLFDYNEFLFLYKIGIPHQRRAVIWESLIDNPCGITRDIYDYYSLKNEENNIDFEEIIKKYEENNCDIDLIFDENSEINRMIIDIIKTEDLFINELYILQKGKNEILSKIFKLVNIFFLMRKDIPYNKNIINYVFVFILVFKDEFISFKNLYNFICSSNILKYFVKEEDIPGRHSILPFDSLLQKYIPRIYQHFKNLNITSELYTFYWYQNLFTRTLNYKTILRVFDRYLIYGDELLIQVGLTIIKIQEEDLLNYTVNEIFKVLKRLPYKYDEYLFFENLELMNKPDINNSIVLDKINSQKESLEDIIKQL